MDATNKKTKTQKAKIENQINKQESSKKKPKKQKLNPLQRERQELYLNQPNQFHNMGFRMLPSLIYRNKKKLRFKRERKIEELDVVNLLVQKEEMRDFFNRWVLGF